MLQVLSLDLEQNSPKGGCKTREKRNSHWWERVGNGMMLPETSVFPLWPAFLGKI